MGRLSGFRYREIIKKLKVCGFSFYRQAAGSHLQGIDWVIVGGESGRKPRPMKEEWVTDVKNQCLDADVAFFFKQWGGTNKKKQADSWKKCLKLNCKEVYSKFCTRMLKQ
jgi:hypothetical protein